MILTNIALVDINSIYQPSLLTKNIPLAKTAHINTGDQKGAEWAWWKNVVIAVSGSLLVILINVAIYAFLWRNRFEKSLF